MRSRLFDQLLILLPRYRIKFVRLGGSLGVNLATLVRMDESASYKPPKHYLDQKLDGHWDPRAAHVFVDRYSAG